MANLKSTLILCLSLMISHFAIAQVYHLKAIQTTSIPLPPDGATYKWVKADVPVVIDLDGKKVVVSSQPLQTIPIQRLKRSNLVGKDTYSDYAVSTNSGGVLKMSIVMLGGGEKEHFANLVLDYSDKEVLYWLKKE